MASGMTSVTFRKLNVEKIADLCAAQKLDGIEWGGDVHVPPGDFRAAESAARLSLGNGLKVTSYGSYFSTDKAVDLKNDLELVCGTAKALGTSVVRIWADRLPYDEADKLYINKFIEKMKLCSDIAAKENITLCFEYHKGTLNDSAEHSKYLLDKINRQNVRTYWQPIDGFEENLKAIAVLNDFIVNVHVYHWRGRDRLLLKEGLAEWREYIKLLNKPGRNFLLEFTRDEDENNFSADAAALISLL